MHHLLSEESTHTASMLGSWCTFPDLIPHNEILSVFKDKSKRSGKGKAKETDDVVDIDMDGATALS
jgi:hypothetical protein